MAAHAAHNAGYHVTLFSKRVEPSQMYGAQYLHAPIPGITDEGKFEVIDYNLNGPIDGYRKKIYGLDNDVDVSPAMLGRTHRAWDIRETYLRLWDLYAHHVEQVYVNADELIDHARYFNIIISTIPRHILCRQDHVFKRVEIWAAGEAPEEHIHLPQYKCPPNTVVCSGWEADSWYRVANIFGRKTVEWPISAQPPVARYASVVKPISTNCSCWGSRKFTFVGRYGAWQKGVLTHHAYQLTRSYLEKYYGDGTRVRTERPGKESRQAR